MYEGIEYQFTLYLPDFKKNREDIIRAFANRRLPNGTICLGTNEEDVNANIDHENVSAFVIVKGVESDETASGTLQIYDWCRNESPDQDNEFVWIHDLCRTGPRGSVSPVKAFMFFVEQLTVQNLGKHDIYLFVDKTNEANKTGLMKIYKENYGYIYNSEEDPSQCLQNQAGDHLLVMRKPNLVADDSISFDFLTTRTKRKYPFEGGKSKRKLITKRRKSKTKSKKKSKSKSKRRLKR